MKSAREVSLALLAILLATLCALPAWAGENKVTILCSPDPAWCEAVKREFSKATGIQTEFVRLSSGAGLARLRAEKANPTFDVWFGGSGDGYWVAQAEDLVEFYHPKAWNDLRPQLTKPVDGHYIPLYSGIHGFGINEKILQEKNLPVPTTWKELGDPKYKGLVGRVVVDPGAHAESHDLWSHGIRAWNRSRVLSTRSDMRGRSSSRSCLPVRTPSAPSRMTNPEKFSMATSASRSRYCAGTGEETCPRRATICPTGLQES